LPGIRPLAEELVMTVNTVAKAYRELEREGVIRLRHGAGAFVSDATKLPPADRFRGAQPLVARTVERLRARNLSDDEIRRLYTGAATPRSYPREIAPMQRKHAMRFFSELRR
jgi:GntR family transcriptional regulator